MNPYVEAHEVGYLLVGGIGLILTGIILVNYVIDLVLRYRSGSNGILRLLAWMTVVWTLFATQTNAYMVIVGISAVLTEPRPFTPNRVFTIVALYALAVASVAVALFTVYVRGQVAKELRK